MRFRLVIFLRAAFLFSVLCCVAYSSDAQDVRFLMSVTPSVAKDASSAVIVFRLRYEGIRPIKANVAWLPGERVFRFISFKADSFPIYDNNPFVYCPKPLEWVFIDDPGVGYKTISPGEDLIQEIDLFKLYENMPNILGKCDFVFYWSYKVYLDGYDAPRVAGTVVIPATLRMKETDSFVSEILAKKFIE